MRIVEVHPGYKKMTDEQLAEHIRQRLGMNPEWARRALLALYDEQSPEEKANPSSVHESNGRGFSPQDQEFLSSLAEQALRQQSFSFKQLGWLYTLLPKYSKQIVKMVRELEKLEKAVVLKLYFAQLTIDNSMRIIKGMTGPLNLDPQNMPDNIMVQSPSGNIMMTFKIKEVYAPEGKVTVYIYVGSIDGIEWMMYIEVGEEEDVTPQNIKDMGKAFGV